MNKVAIIDYGLCNLDSVRRAVEECGGDPFITDQPEALEAANRLILPGVGAFPDAMRNLQQHGLVEAMAEQVLGKGIPFLGVCLGMQLMASTGWEVAETPGLGWIEGDVRRLEPADGARVPHIGWNEVELASDSPLFTGVPPKSDFYFVHSFSVRPRHEAEIVGRTPYGGGYIVSAVQRGLIFGVQFHPEKSQRLGFRVLKNFLAV